VLILFNKPFRVLSQFQDPDGRPTLGDFIDQPGVYPAGRLDYDSEGLMVLTDDGRLQARISQPRAATRKTYWVQVEGEPASNSRTARRAPSRRGVSKSRPSSGNAIHPFVTERTSGTAGSRLY